MKLYELPRNTKFTIVGDDDKIVFILHRIDGMYSYCTRDSGNILDTTPVHMSTSTEVKIYVDKL